MSDKNILKLIVSFFMSSFFIEAIATDYNWKTPAYSEDYSFVTHDGAWCWFSDPRAIYVDNKIVGGFVDKGGNIWAFSYDPANQEANQCRLFDDLDYDDHANPSIMVLPDKRLVMFFSAHGGTKTSPIYYAISKNPADITSWNELQSINPVMEGKLGVCYSNPVMLSEENNRTYVFFRGRNFKPTFVATDDFMTWSDPVTFVVNDEGYGTEGRPYMKVATNHKDKIFFAFTDAHPRNRATNSIYFMMYKGGKLYGADGRIIADDIRNAVSPCLADKVYDATGTADKAWIWDVAFDKDENPVLVYARFENEDGRHSYWYACWNGKKWENYKITDAVTWFMRNDYNNKNKLETENNYSGGVYLDHNNPKIVYTSRPVDGIFEIEKWTFVGGKEKWNKVAVTEQSERDNVRPFVVRDYPEGYPNLIWMYNYRYPGFRSYDCALRINQKAKSFDSAITKEAISDVAEKVADWQLRDYKDKPFGSMYARGWRNGVLYNGMFDWAELSGDKKYFDFLKNIFDKEFWQLGNRLYDADDFCVGQAYLDMYIKYGKEEMLLPTYARAEWVVEHEPESNIDITKGKSQRWWWCDALFMAPAVYTRLYSITGEKRFIKFADKEFKACYEHLYDKEEHLFYRDAKYFDMRENNGRKVFWGRGNGWVMGGLVEILKTLPEKDRKYRVFYENLFIEMAAEIACLQKSDGFWGASLLDTDTYSDPETSGTSLYVYALAYGVNTGLLSKEEYLPVIRKGWEALVASVDTEGKLCWVQPVGQAPKKIEKKSNLTYGTGGFLLAACEVYKLAE